ncbi:MAG: hypothetical protein RIG84_16750 [Roseovarius sp.]
MVRGDAPGKAEPPRQPLGITLAKILLVIVLLVAVNHGFALLRDWLHIDIRPSNEEAVHRTIMLAALLYTLALAVPFVPGVEIGLALIVLLGAPIVPLVYLCTVSGLMIAFLVGRVVPMGVLVALARDLRLARLEGLLTRFDAVPKPERLDFVLASARGGHGRRLLRYRYLAVAAAINLPGNFLLGGGGGIAMLCGMSRLFSPPVFALTVMVAVAPVPLLVIFFGPSVLAGQAPGLHPSP